MDKEPMEQTTDLDEMEARFQARAYILAAIDEGWPPEDILDGLSSFWDGDPVDLF